MSDGPRVVGGSHDIEADVDDMFRTGGVLRRRGLDAGEVAVTCHGFLVDANLLHSAPFSPGSFATFEATLLGALDGPDGLTRHAVEMSVSGTVLQGRATAYYAFDRAQQMSLDVRAWAQGTALAGGVVATPALLLGMAVTNPVGTLLLGTTASANREGLLAAATPTSSSTRASWRTSSRRCRGRSPRSARAPPRCCRRARSSCSPSSA